MAMTAMTGMTATAMIVRTGMTGMTAMIVRRRVMTATAMIVTKTKRILKATRVMPVMIATAIVSGRVRRRRIVRGLVKRGISRMELQIRNPQSKKHENKINHGEYPRAIQSRFLLKTHEKIRKQKIRGQKYTLATSLNTLVEKQEICQCDGILQRKP